MAQGNLPSIAPKQATGDNVMSAKDLENILAVHYSKPSPFKYREKAGKTNAKTIAEKVDLLKAIKEAFGTLTVPKTMLADGLSSHFDQQSWRIDKDEWVTASAKRLKCMCYDASQALAKRPRSSWIVKLFGEAPATKKKPPGGGEAETQTIDTDDGDEEEDEEEPEDESLSEDGASDDKPLEDLKLKKRPATVKPPTLNKSVQNTTPFFYGYCEEQEKAWRSKVGDSKQTKEWCHIGPYIKAGSKETDCMYVEWPGEQPVALCGLLVSDWRAKQTAKGSKGCVGFLADGSEVCVRLLRDRRPLCIILVDGVQKCQVKVGVFLAPALAEAFMRELANDTVVGKIALGDLYKERDDRLAKVGLGAEIEKPSAKASAPIATPNEPKKAAKKAAKGKASATKKPKLERGTSAAVETAAKVPSKRADFDCNEGMNPPPDSMDMEVDAFDETLEW
jgi:hypothetical protein